MDIHDGYWSEPSDELDSDGKPIKRQRWVFTNPAHPSNQTGQGSPALSGEISHNSSEVEYGEPESTDNRTRLSFNGNPPTHADSDSEGTAESDRTACTGGNGNNHRSSTEVMNEQEDKTTGVDDTQQHDNSDPDTAGLTRPDDNSRVGDGVVEPPVALNNAPHVARETTAATVLPFATRGTTKPLKPTSATRGTQAGEWKIDYVRASENTYAFRMRWTQGRKRGTPIYISRVSATVFQMIRKGDYEQFKKGLISDYCARTLRASNQA